MKKIILIATGILFLMSTAAFADMYVYQGGKVDGKDAYTYVATTDLDIPVAWTPSADAESYELELYSVNRKTFVARAKTTEPSLTFKAPFQGLFIVRIRSVNGEGDTAIYSDWVTADSPDTGLVDGTPRGWWIYAFLAPPGPIQ
jgi:hypothetical protein